MRYRRFGRTGLNVSEIGYGAWGIGQHLWVGAQDDESIRSLKAARDAGINFFDTALAYGDGHSEQLIARAFGRSPDVIIATKVPPKNLLWPAPEGIPLQEVFPRAYVLECMNRSVQNLQRDIDLFQFHVWQDAWTDDPEWRQTVDDIRKSGRVRFLGISINDHQPSNAIRALKSGLIDAVQVIYNIFDQSPDDELLPYCQKRDIGVIARVPFDEGSLTGKIRPETQFPPDDFRNEYFRGERKQEVWDRVRKLSQDAAVPLERMPELALRFCLSNPAVSTVIPGMRNTRHVQTNANVSNEGPLPAELLKKIRPHRWVRDYYS